MSDTPDVLGALAERLHQWVHACPGDGTCGSMACHVGYYTFIEHAAANDLLAFFDERGEAVVKAPGLSHGDELVRVDGLRVTGTQAAPTFNQEPVWRRLRRSVPENGDTRDALVSSPQWQADVAEAEAAIERGDLGESSTHAELVRRMRQERSER